MTIAQIIHLPVRACCVCEGGRVCSEVPADDVARCDTCKKVMRCSTLAIALQRAGVTSNEDLTALMKAAHAFRGDHVR